MIQDMIVCSLITSLLHYSETINSCFQTTVISIIVIQLTVLERVVSNVKMATTYQESTAPIVLHIALPAPVLPAVQHAMMEDTEQLVHLDVKPHAQAAHHHHTAQAAFPEDTVPHVRITVPLAALIYYVTKILGNVSKVVLMGTTNVKMIVTDVQRTAGNVQIVHTAENVYLDIMVIIASCSVQKVVRTSYVIRN